MVNGRVWELLMVVMVRVRRMLVVLVMAEWIVRIDDVFVGIIAISCIVDMMMLMTIGQFGVVAVAMAIITIIIAVEIIEEVIMVIPIHCVAITIVAIHVIDIIMGIWLQHRH